MLFIETAKSDIEAYSYHILHGALKGPTYYVFKSGSISSYACSSNIQIKEVEVKNIYENLKGELRYLKTIPINQLKMMLAIKPDLRIEDLLDGLHAN